MGEKLKKIREKWNLSREVMAHTLGYSMQMLMHYENNKTAVPHTLLENIIKKYNVDPYWLFNITDEQKENFEDYEIPE